MRKEFLVIAGALTLALTLLATGCGTETDSPGSSSGAGGQAPVAGSGATGAKGGSAGVGSGAGGTGGTGGSANPGGSTGAGGELTCSSVTACGGNVVGTWNVTSSCLKISGDMDVSIANLGCKTVPAKGSLQATGTFVANADGTYSDRTTTTGSVTFPLSPACLTVSSVPVTCSKVATIFVSMGWKTPSCSDASGECVCSLSTEQKGGPGFIAAYTELDASYTTADDTLTINQLKYSYCAATNTLTLTPQTSALTGSVSFQREGTLGAGGAAAAGGAGGAPSAGGAAGAAATGGSAGASGGSGGAAAGAGGAGGATAGSAGMAGSAGASAGAAGSAGGPGTLTGPCDIYKAGGTTCVAAHSTIRVLVSTYTGALYQVKRASDKTTKDIPSAGGFADSAQQEAFCTGTTCTITKVYDQSDHGNFLEAETPDSSVGGAQGETAANAAAEALTISGHKVYSLYIRPSQAYWRDGSKSGMPLGAEPQGIYMVTSGKHYNGGCCFDYGNGETSRKYVAGPSMDAIYFGNSTQWGSGNGTGPWIMADMEDGMVAQGGGGKNNNLMSQTSTYVTAMEKNNGTTEFALKAADATKTPLNTYYQGALPPGKNPMKKQGSIVLGSGGDCCLTNNNLSEGTFYEGAIVAGYPSNATDDAIHKNIVDAGYGK